jgi:hypothetical protein
MEIGINVTSMEREQVIGFHGGVGIDLDNSDLFHQ